MRPLLQVQTFLYQWIRWWRNNSCQLHPVLIFLIAYNVDTLDRTIGERRHIVTVELSVRPVDISSTTDSCKSAFTEEDGEQLSQEIKDAVENGVQSSYLQGSTDSSHLFSFFRAPENGCLSLTRN